ncbi:hypothetical protein D3C71_1103290 [compost metagenome]
MTVLFGSALPLTLAPSPATVNPVGGFGAMLSRAIAVAGILAFPAASEAMTEMVWPLVCAGLSAMVKLPLPSAVPVQL